MAGIKGFKKKTHPNAADQACPNCVVRHLAPAPGMHYCSLVHAAANEVYQRCYQSAVVYLLAQPTNKPKGRFRDTLCQKH